MKNGIHQRRPGVWLVKVSAGPDPEKPGHYLQRHEIVHGNKADAEIRRGELLKQIRGGDTLDGRRITVREWAEHWMAGLDVSRKTAERYRQLVNLQIIPNLGTIKLRKLAPLEIEALYVRLRAEGRKVPRKGADGGVIRGLSGRSVHHVHVVLGTMLAAAARLGKLERNPMDRVRPPKANANRTAGEDHSGTGAKTKAFTKDQMARLLAAFRNDELFELAALGVDTGARLGELLALRWRDIDHAGHRLLIERSVDDPSKGLPTIKTPKNKSSERTIEVNAELCEILRRRWARHAEAALLRGKPLSDEALIFPASALKPMAPRHTRDVCKRVKVKLRALGLAEFSFHCLRHTHGSQLLHDGVSLPEVSQRLGHASVATTARVYAHVLKRPEHSAAVSAGALLRAALADG